MMTSTRKIHYLLVAILCLTIVLLARGDMPVIAGDFDPEFVGVLFVGSMPDRPTFLVGVSGAFTFEVVENGNEKSIDLRVARVRRGSPLQTRVGVLGIDEFSAQITERLVVRFKLTPPAVSNVRYKVNLTDYGIAMTFAPKSAELAGFQLIDSYQVIQGGGR